MTRVPEIDWLAVDMVVREGYSLRLRRVENLAVIRRLKDRIIGVGEWSVDLPPNRLTAEEVARRLCTTERSVIRWRAALPAADKATCAVCGEEMWVRQDGAIEPHPTRLFKTCLGGQQARESA